MTKHKAVGIYIIYSIVSVISCMREKRLHGSLSLRLITYMKNTCIVTFTLITFPIVFITITTTITYKI